MNIKDLYFYTLDIKEQIDASLNMKTEFLVIIKKIVLSV